MFWNVAKKALLEDIKRFITKWSNLTGRDESCFSEWKCKLIQLIEDAYHRHRNRIKIQPTRKVLNDEECKKELEELKSKYVMAPIDKASNNISFVCKKYYLKVIIEEVYSDTYDHYTDSKEDVIKHLVKENAQKAGIGKGSIPMV